MSQPGQEKITRAQKRIKKLLREKGDNGDFEITPTLVLYWWRQLNLAVFQGMLRQPVEIQCKIFKDGTWGWCKPRRYMPNSNVFDKDVRIGIRRDLDDWYTFLTVLAHEMVHQYEWVHHGRMTHGKKSFYMWETKLKECTGLPLHENTFPPGHDKI